MSLPDKSSAGATPCSGCLDLRPELYQSLRDVNPSLFKFFGSPKHKDIRYYISSFSGIEKASNGGCKFCSILVQGMRHFWNLDAVAKSISRETSDGADCDEEMEYSDDEPGIASSISGNEVEDIYHPCIEIRPRRGLVVSVVSRCGELLTMLHVLSGGRSDLNFHRFHFGQVRAPLQFYSISGTKAQFCYKF